MSLRGLWMFRALPRMTDSLLQPLKHSTPRWAHLPFLSQALDSRPFPTFHHGRLSSLWGRGSCCVCLSSQHSSSRADSVCASGHRPRVRFQPLPATLLSNIGGELQHRACGRGQTGSPRGNSAQFPSSVIDFACWLWPGRSPGAGALCSSRFPSCWLRDGVVKFQTSNQTGLNSLSLLLQYPLRSLG